MSQDSSVSKGTAMAQFLAGAVIIIPFATISIVTLVVTQPPTNKDWRGSFLGDKAVTAQS